MKKGININSVTWGIPPFDQISFGIPANEIGIIETPNYHSGMIILGQYLYEGLSNGESCALITFDSAVGFLENFLMWNLDFEKFLNEEKFFLLNYKPNVTVEAGLTNSYDQIFEEIVRLCNGKAPQRVAIHQIDSLINLSNIVLMNNCAQKIAITANAPITSKTTILGQYVQFNDDIHKSLSVALQKTMPGFFSLTQNDPLKIDQYSFSVKKLPWFGYSHQSVDLILKEGVGFVKVDKHNIPKSA